MSIPADGQSYYIMAYARPLTLDLAGGNPANGTPCLGWTPHFDQSARNRVWTFNEGGQGAWFISNLETKTQLTLEGDSNGAPVVCSSGNASPGNINLWWVATLPPVPGQVTSWTIQGKQTNAMLGLAQGTSDGTKVVAGGSDPMSTQWILIPVPNV